MYYFSLTIHLASRKASLISNGGTTPTGSSAKAVARTAKSDGIKVTTGSGDPTRDKCTELIYDSLAIDSGAPNDLILKRAKAIEVAVLNDIGSTATDYKQKIRSLFVNFKTNGTLRENVVSGEVAAEKLATMSSHVRILVFRSCYSQLNPSIYRTWLQRSVKQRITKSSRKTFSLRLVQRSNRQKQMPSSVHAASRGNVAIARLKPDLLMNR